MIRYDISNFDWKKMNLSYELILKDVLAKIEENSFDLVSEVLELDKGSKHLEELLLGDKDILEKYIEKFDGKIKEIVDNIEINSNFKILQMFKTLGNNSKVENIETNLREKIKKDTTIDSVALDAFIDDMKLNINDHNRNITIANSDFKNYLINSKYNWFSEYSIINDKFSDIFDYTKFTKQYRHSIISAMNVRTCLYCNRQYITNFKDDKDKDKTSAELDHFYPKSRYPYLALSLHNFIPCCHYCNSIKSNNNELGVEHLYPYKNGFEDKATFSICSDNLDYLYNNSTDFIIKITNEHNDNSIKNSIDVFNLSNLYRDAHNDFVLELIKKAKYYCDSQIQEYIDIFPNIFESKDEITQLIFGNYTQDIDLNLRPLSKLTRDILIELGVELT